MPQDVTSNKEGLEPREGMQNGKVPSHSHKGKSAQENLIERRSKPIESNKEAAMASKARDKQKLTSVFNL